MIKETDMTEKTTARRIADLILAGNGIGKTEDTVTIACEDADAANTLLDLLIRLADEEVPLPATAPDQE